PREILRVTGIPVDPLFSAAVDRAAARKHLGLDASTPVILIAAGGYGIGPVEQLVRDLLALQKPWQIVAIAGKSEQVKKKLDALASTAGKLVSSNSKTDEQKGPARLVPVGFTREMDQYMAAADLLVGKAGG